MKKLQLRQLLFLALCCDLGMFAKRLVAPTANVITDALHIPGGIGTSFSLMFLVVAAELFPNARCGAVMGFVQSMLALALGQVGSMGALSPLGYIVPGIVIDLVLGLSGRIGLGRTDRMVLANLAAAVAAACAANLIVFRLEGLVLLLYVSVAAATGSICGSLGAKIAERLQKVVGAQRRRGGVYYEG